MDTMPPIKFTVLLSFKDLVQFNVHILMKGFRKVFIILMYVFFVPLSIASLFQEGEKPAFAIAFACVLLVLPILSYVQLKKSFKTNKNLHEPIEYTIDEENIHLKGLTFESTISVQNLYKVAENKRAFYLWQSNNAANLIPKHLLSQENIVALSVWKERVTKKK